MLKFTIHTTQAGFHVVQSDNNNEPLNTSEVLTSHEAAIKNIKAVYRNCGTNVSLGVIDLHLGLKGFIKKTAGGIKFDCSRKMKK